jgi:hypothetical protein
VSRLWIISGSLLFVAASSLTQTSTPQRSGGCTDEDYAIFSAALEGEDGNHKLNSVILLDHTATGYPPGLAATTGVRRNEVQAFYNDVPKDAKDDFEARNKTRVELDTEKIKTPFQTLALSDKEAEKMLYRKNGWEEFHQKYPGGAILAIISRPGINREHNRALLYMGESCGPVCGGGTLLLLGKQDGKWKIINTATVWMS